MLQIKPMALRICSRYCLYRRLYLLQKVVNPCVVSFTPEAQLSSNGNKDGKDLNSLFQPLPVRLANSIDDINIGAELTSKLKKG